MQSAGMTGVIISDCTVSYQGVSTIRAHFVIRRVCFARHGIESSCICGSHGPRLIYGGLQPPYPPLCFGALFLTHPQKAVVTSS